MRLEREGVEVGPGPVDVAFEDPLGVLHAEPVAGPAHPGLPPRGEGHRLRREGDLWVLQGNAVGDWADLYAFTLEPHYPVDFEMANHFTSTHPRSAFVLNLAAQRSWPERRALLRNRDLVVREDGSSTATTVRDPDHLLEILDSVFGLAFPPGTRFARPEF